MASFRLYLYETCAVTIRRFALLYITAAWMGFAAADAFALDPRDPNTGGAGDLLVAPTRVVLEGRKRAAEVILNNTGTKEATYRISLVSLHMDEKGQYHETAPADAKSPTADGLLRYSPRQVTLKPGESQTIKIMARGDTSLPDGEYRSHLAFHATPDLSLGEDVEAKAKAKDGEIAIRLVPVYGVSIPVIVRRGELEATAGISEARSDGKTVSLNLVRSGGKSVYGDVVVASGDKIVAEMRGVAVLLPNRKRQVTLTLDNPPPQGATLSITYRARAEDGGAVLATSSVKL
jgi:hypothetical protein